MSSTRTIIVDFERLHTRGAEAVLVARLMRAADDIALANWGLRAFRKDQPRIRRHIQPGACRYFIRLQCGHLSEAIPLVEELSRTPELVRILRACSLGTQRAYRRVRECVRGGRRRGKFERWVLPVRNRLGACPSNRFCLHDLTRARG